MPEKRASAQVVEPRNAVMIGNVTKDGVAPHPVDGAKIG
jgi:hypothetical protein